MAAVTAGWGFRNLGNARKNEATAVAEKERANENASKARVAQVNAEQAERIARSRQLAAQSTSELGKNNYELAMLLAIESGKVTGQSRVRISNG